MSYHHHETDVVWLHDFARQLLFVRELCVRGPDPSAPVGCELVAYTTSTQSVIRCWYLKRSEPLDGVSQPSPHERGKLVDPSTIRAGRAAASINPKRRRLNRVAVRLWQAVARGALSRPWRRALFRLISHLLRRA